jgi:hypothetical protein
MVKIAIVKNMTFNIKFSIFDDYDKIINDYLKDRIEYHKIDTSEDLINIVRKHLLPDETNPIEELQCVYDNNQLINYIVKKSELMSNNSEMDCVIFYKRSIIENDTYKFAPNIDYNYQNMYYSDIYNILKRKHICSGLIIKPDNEILEIEFDHVYLENYIGVLNYKLGESKTIKYLDPANVFNDEVLSNKDVENAADYYEALNANKSPPKIDSSVNIELAKQIQNNDVEWILSQRETTFGIFNCFYTYRGNEYNPIMSRFLRTDVRGEFIISMFKHSSVSNQDTPICITKEIFENLLSLEKIDIQCSNKNFYNFYCELNYNLDKFKNQV